MATLWLLGVGGEAEEALPESTFLDVTVGIHQHRKQRKATQLRTVSIFRRGLNAILVALLRQEALPLGTFKPEPWPELWPQQAALAPPEQPAQRMAA